METIRGFDYRRAARNLALTVLLLSAIYPLSSAEIAPRVDSDTLDRSPATTPSYTLAQARQRPTRGGLNVDELEVTIEPDATLKVLYRKTPIMRAKFLYWGTDWKWAGSRMTVGDRSGSTYPISGEVRSLGITLGGDIAMGPGNVYTLSLELDANRDLNDIVGGGIEWMFAVGSRALGGTAQQPVLLPGDMGWRWTLAPGKVIEVVFSEPLARIHIEKGKQTRIRTVYVGNNLSAGRHRVEMKMTLPEGSRYAPSPGERLASTDRGTWYRNALARDTSPVDLRFLNHRPAGTHGFLEVKGDQLVFEDGTPARFWGGNLAAYALFQPKAEIERQATRIAKLGYNLMRIHHHDSTGWVRNAVIDDSRSDSRRIDPNALDQIDYWIKCLKDEGVYVWLDLHVGRIFKRGDVDTEFGRIEGFEEINDGSKEREGTVKGFTYFSPAIQDLMHEFAAKYLGHVNPYTGNAYKDEPAVMGVLITNENDLTRHFGNRMLPDKGNPTYNALFNEAARAFSRQTGLDGNLIVKTWVPGPSKIFLNHQEHLFNRKMIGKLRDLGVRVPIATTNVWGGMGWESLPSIANDGDVVDIHSYSKADQLTINLRNEANLISWIGANQVYGKPLTITEWNVSSDAPDRISAPLYLAAVASLQGWDAPMIFNYSQMGFKAGQAIPLRHITFADTAITGATPAAAVAFREGHIRQAEKTYFLKLSREQVYYGGLNASNSATARTLIEQSRFTIGLPDIQELDWDEETRPDASVIVLTDPNRDFIPPGENAVDSDTGELHHDWGKGIYLIDTPKTQAASGWIGGETFSLGDLTVSVSNPMALVVATSLDGAPIRESRKILITALAQVVQTRDRRGYDSEPVEGTLKLRAPEGAKVYPLAPDGAYGDPLPATFADGLYDIRLSVSAGSHWFLVESRQ